MRWALLEELVAIDTENPPGRALGRCGRFLHDATERLGLSAELIELAPSRELQDPCIVRASVGDGPSTIYLHGHFDVVPAQDPAQATLRLRDAPGAPLLTVRGTARYADTRSGPTPFGSPWRWRATVRVSFALCPAAFAIRGGRTPVRRRGSACFMRFAWQGPGALDNTIGRALFGQPFSWTAYTGTPEANRKPSRRWRAYVLWVLRPTSFALPGTARS
jgi:hypothetical protein